MPFESGESSQAPLLLLSVAPNLTALRAVLSLSSWDQEHWRRTAQSHCVPSTDLARLIIILAGSTLTQSGQTSPRGHVPSHAALATQCCAYSEKLAAVPVLAFFASGRTALNARELLALTSGQKLPSSSLLLFRSVIQCDKKMRACTFTRAHMCIYFTSCLF